MGVDDFRYLWDGSEEGWSLMHLNADKPAEDPRYAIINTSSRQALIIEDDVVYAEAIKVMLEAGALVLTSLPWAREPGS